MTATTLVWIAACGEDTPTNQIALPETANSALECGEPLMVCSERCVDLRVDPEHCGACDEACAEDAFCSDGQCVDRCGDSTELCGRSCVDTQTSRANCGGCGQSCDAEQACVEGECKASGGDGDGDRDASVDEDVAASCCEGSLDPGCASPEIQACVCEVDDFCCTAAWDDVCVGYVSSEGCGTCGDAMPAGSCEATTSIEDLPATLSGTLDGAGSSVDISCGSEGEREVLFAYTAPEAGTYTFDTAGSEIFDSVLAVLDGLECNADELACNDDDGDELRSRITLDLREGQEVLLVVESWGSELGDVEVSVAAGSGNPVSTECAPTALGSTLPAVASGTVSEAASELTPSCAATSEGELLYSFTAPAAGNYRFDTSGSTADTILQILEADCAGDELACNDDSDLGGLAAVVDVQLAANQTVIVNLDSYNGEGDFVLNISQSVATTVTSCCLAHEAAGCEDTEIAACVCADDDYCCENTWDELCVYAVEDLGCGGC